MELTHPAADLTDAEIEGGALTMINAARHACGQPVLLAMPRSLPGDRPTECRCPVAVAFEFLGEVDVDLVISVPPEHKVQAALIGEAWGLEADSCQSFSSGWTHIAAGPIVDEFIKRFDQGNYPHLSEAIL